MASDGDEVKRANARAAMMDDLGIGRVEALPLDDTDPHAPRGRHGRPVPIVRQPLPALQVQRLRPHADEASNIADRWKSAIDSGAFKDEDAAAVEDLDDLGGGRLYETRRNARNQTTQLLTRGNRPVQPPRPSNNAVSSRTVSTAGHNTHRQFSSSPMTVRRRGPDGDAPIKNLTRKHLMVPRPSRNSSRPQSPTTGHVGLSPTQARLAKLEAEWTKMSQTVLEPECTVFKTTVLYRTTAGDSVLVLFLIGQMVPLVRDLVLIGSQGEVARHPLDVWYDYISMDSTEILCQFKSPHGGFNDLCLFFRNMAELTRFMEHLNNLKDGKWELLPKAKAPEAARGSAATPPGPIVATERPPETNSNVPVTALSNGTGRNANASNLNGNASREIVPSQMAKAATIIGKALTSTPVADTSSVGVTTLSNATGRNANASHQTGNASHKTTSKQMAKAATLVGKALTSTSVADAPSVGVTTSDATSGGVAPSGAVSKGAVSKGVASKGTVSLLESPKKASGEGILSKTSPVAESCPSILDEDIPDLGTRSDILALSDDAGEHPADGYDPFSIFADQKPSSNGQESRDVMQSQTYKALEGLFQAPPPTVETAPTSPQETEIDSAKTKILFYHLTEVFLLLFSGTVDTSNSEERREHLQGIKEGIAGALMPIIEKDESEDRRALKLKVLKELIAEKGLSTPLQSQGVLASHDLESVQQLPLEVETAVTSTQLDVGSVSPTAAEPVQQLPEDNAATRTSQTYEIGDLLSLRDKATAAPACLGDPANLPPRAVKASSISKPAGAKLDLTDAKTDADWLMATEVKVNAPVTIKEEAMVTLPVLTKIEPSTQPPLIPMETVDSDAIPSLDMTDQKANGTHPAQLAKSVRGLAASRWGPQSNISSSNDQKFTGLEFDKRKGNRTASSIVGLEGTKLPIVLETDVTIHAPRQESFTVSDVSGEDTRAGHKTSSSITKLYERFDALTVGSNRLPKNTAHQLSAEATEFSMPRAVSMPVKALPVKGLAHSRHAH